MHYSRRQIQAAIAVAAVGTAGGMMLAGFTTSGMWPSSPVAPATTWSPTDTPAPIVPDPPPEHYVCTGCFPTLAERQAQYYAAVDMGDGSYVETAQLAPQPPYEPVPYDEEADENAERQAQADDLQSDPVEPAAEVAYW